MRRLVPAFAALLVAALAAAAPAAGAGDALRSQQWGLDMIEADAAHQVTTGAGAVVAVVDSGVYAAHSDLAGRRLLRPGVVDNASTPQDDSGRGTAVLGVIAAEVTHRIR